MPGKYLTLIFAAAAQPPQIPQELPDTVTLRADVVYCKAGERELKLDLVTAKAAAAKPRPALVYIHGGAWLAGDKSFGRRRLAHFAEAGYVGVSVGYRLSGEARWPAQIHDSKCAIRYLRANAKELNLDANKIAVWGDSAGGHLVSLLGTSGDVKELEGSLGWPGVSSRVQAVVDWYGPTDFLRMDKQIHGKCRGGQALKHSLASSPESKLLGAFIEAVPDKVREASPLTYVSADDPPFLIQHGDADCTVPTGQSQLLQTALNASRVKVTMHILIGAGHGGPAFSTPANLAVIRDFLAAALR